MSDPTGGGTGGNGGTISRLGLVVDASGMVTGSTQGKQALDVLMASADQAEQRIQGFSKSATASVGSLGSAVRESSATVQRDMVAVGNALGQGFRPDTNAVRANAITAAELFVKSASAEFEADQVRIREGLARGFLSPAEAQKAGREAAQAYNAGVLSQLDKLGAVGLNVGNSATYAQLAGSIKSIDNAAGGAHANVGRLGQEITTLARRTLDTSPVVGQFGYLLGQFAVGSVATVGILAGAAAIGLAWNALTEDARKAREEHEHLLVTLDDIAKRRRETTIGNTQAAIQAGQDELEKLRQKLNVQQILAQGAAEGGALPFVNPDKTKKAIDDLVGKIASAEGELRNLSQRSAEESDRATTNYLAAVVKAGQATTTQINNAKLLLKGYQDAFAALQRLHPGDLAGQAGVLESIRTLQDALNPPTASNREATQQRSLENLLALDVQRVDAARRLADAADRGRAAFDAENHSQELARTLLEEQQRILQSHLDVHGKIRAGEEAQVRAEQASAAARIATVDALQAHARAALQLETNNSAIAVLRAKIAAYNNVATAADLAGAAIRDAGVDEEYARNVAIANAAANEADRRALLASAAALREKTLQEHAAAEAARARAELSKTISEETGPAFSRSLDQSIRELTDRQARYQQDLVSIWRDGFERMAADASKSMHALAGDVADTLDRARARIAYEGNNEGAGYNALALGSIGLGAAVSGYGVGRSLGGGVGSAVGGAATGALIGSEILPGIGTLVGGLAGLTGGLLGGADAAHQRQRAEEQLRQSLTQTIEQIKAQVGVIPEIAGQIAAVHQQFDALRHQAEQSGGSYADFLDTFHTLNDLEIRRIAQLEEEAVALRESTRLGLQERLLRAQGDTTGADALRRQADQLKEITDIITKYGPFSDLLQLLLQTQDTENAAVEKARALANTRAIEDANLAAQRAYASGPNGTQQLRDTVDLQALILQHQRDIADLEAQKASAELIAATLAKNAAEEAGLAWQQMIAQVDAANSAIQQDVRLGFKTPQQAFAEEALNYGFGSMSIEDIKKYYTPYSGTPLTDFQKETNKHIDQLLTDWERWFGSGASGGGLGSSIGPSPAGQREAITYAAQAMTEATGNRLADYESAQLIEARKHTALLTDIAGGRRFGGSVNDIRPLVPVPSVIPGAAGPSNITIRIYQQPGEDGGALAKRIASEVQAILASDAKADLLRNGDPLKVGG